MIRIFSKWRFHIFFHTFCFNNWKLFHVYRRLEISHPLRCFTILSPKTMTDFCVLVWLFFLITCLFSDFRFLLSVLFDRAFSISLDFPTVKSTLGVLITHVFKSLLFVVSVLCESFWCCIFFCYFLLTLWINNWCFYYLTVFWELSYIFFSNDMYVQLVHYLLGLDR